jgi:N-methylhydantoinase B
MPASVAAVIEIYGDEVAPDSQYAVNDPYAGGTHLNDLTLVRPVFIDSRMIGWVANRAHHADVGGEAPGSMPAHATTVDQEGIRVAPMLAVASGRFVAGFIEPFLAATRTPEERIGDLSAQLGANEAGARQIEAYAGAMGVARFEEIAAALLDYGERRMVAAIESLPDGRYEFADFMEWHDEDLPIRAAVTISGARLEADFEGTTSQIEGNINAVEAVTRSCLYYAVRVATDPTIPANGGCYRPLRLLAPSGSLVNATPPAAVAAGNVETSQRIADVLLGALAQAAPDRVPAAGQGTMNNILVGGDGFAYYETVAGGQGGARGKPGESGIHTGMTNTKNTPIEALESHYPFRVTQYSLRAGSGGRGEFPGGAGIEREIEFLAAATVSLMGERRRIPPWGLNGGGPGACGEDWLVTANGRRERLPAKSTFEVRAGDRLHVMTPGGGGWGPAQRRASE